MNEALTTLAHLGDKIRVIEILYELVDSNIYSGICDRYIASVIHRIEQGLVPVIGKEGLLEFPYIGIKN